LHLSTKYYSFLVGFWPYDTVLTRIFNGYTSYFQRKTCTAFIILSIAYDTLRKLMQKLSRLTLCKNAAYLK